MYIKIYPLANYYAYAIYAANHKRICESFNYWEKKSRAIKAAIKLAIDLDIEYKETGL